METNILHYFFESNGILVVLRTGASLYEATPSGMTAGEHLDQIKAKHGVKE